MRRPTRARFGLCLAAAVALPAVAGCGEKSEPATTGPVVPQSTSPIDGGTTTTPERTDEQQATTAARVYLISSDAAQVCDEVITPELLKRAYGNRQGCITARKPQTLAKSVTVNEVRVQGGTATVQARASGGRYGNGQPVRLTVERQGATWRVAKTS